MSRSGKSWQTLQMNFQVLRENPKLHMDIYCQEKPEIPEDLKSRVMWLKPLDEKQPDQIKIGANNLL